MGKEPGSTGGQTRWPQLRGEMGEESWLVSINAAWITVCGCLNPSQNCYIPFQCKNHQPPSHLSQKPSSGHLLVPTLNLPFKSVSRHSWRAFKCILTALLTCYLHGTPCKRNLTPRGWAGMSRPLRAHKMSGTQQMLVYGFGMNQRSSPPSVNSFSQALLITTKSFQIASTFTALSGLKLSRLTHKKNNDSP